MKLTNALALVSLCLLPLPPLYGQDVINKILTYTKVSSAWLAVSPDSSFSGTPTPADTGVNSFTVNVDDGVNSPVETTLNIAVIARATVPAGDVISQCLSAGSSVSEESLWIFDLRVIGISRRA